MLQIVRRDVQLRSCRYKCAGQIAGVETASSSFDLDDNVLKQLMQVTHSKHRVALYIMFNLPAQNYLPSTEHIIMVLPATYSLTVKLSNLKRAPPKVTLLRCQC